MNEFRLYDFVRESNRIESIHREPTLPEIDAHERLINCEELRIEDVSSFVTAVAGENAILRNRRGLNVRVGTYLPPQGGPEVLARLVELCKMIDVPIENDSHKMIQHACWYVHCEYETLHPFMDGNGRSGRALWLRMMHRGGLGEYALHLGFLRAFYYQTLQAPRMS